MKLIPSNQGNRNSNFFGLLASRFLFQGPKRNPHETPHDEVTGTLQENVDTYAEAVERLRKQVEGYNTQYGDTVEDKDKVEGVHYQTLTFDPNKLADIRQQIEIIKAIKEREAAQWTTDKQFNYLADMLEYIKVVQSFPEECRESIESAHRSRLQRRHEFLTQAQERKDLWGKNQKTYEELSDSFDNLASTPAFKDVWQTPEGFSSEKQREAKQLFLAIMAEKTDGFKNTFVLGDDFGNDPEANIQNFPYIYNEFLKIEGAAIVGDNVSPEKILGAQTEVENARRNILSKGIGTPEDIIARNPDASITPADLAPEPAMPDSEGWQARVSSLDTIARKYDQKADSQPDLPQKTPWIEAAKAMRMHLRYAQASLDLSTYKTSENKVKSKFTFNELNSPTRRLMVMDLAMKQFVKALQMVDKGPFGNSDWSQNLHPTVRRMLIASIYDHGVAAYETDERGNVTYKENTNNENVWMMGTLFQSDYFNFKEFGDKMDDDHNTLLQAVFLGSKLTVMLKKFEPTEKFLAAWIKVREEEAAIADPRKRQQFLEEQLKDFPPEMIAQFSPEKFDLPTLKLKQTELQENRAKLEEFLKKTRAAMKVLYTKEKPDDSEELKKQRLETKQFIEEMRAGVYAGELPQTVRHLGQIAMIDAESMDDYAASMNNLQINFKTIELQEKNSLMFFEGMGMHIEGIEPKYLEAIQKDPSVKTENWTSLLLGDDAEFEKLIALFQFIIPNDTAGGKGDFIVSLRSLHKKYRANEVTELPSGLEGQTGSEDSAILNVLSMLKIHLTGRAETAAQSDLKQKEVEARLKGLHIGDKITPYVKGVWDMLTGPGQSVANRAAGLVLMYGFYKSARLAMKGEGKVGKALRATFVALAIEIATKKITGRGILDRLGLDAISGAMEGTYESVLLQDGRTRMEKIDGMPIPEEEHAAALMQLNNVPFDQIMTWYENSDVNGNIAKPGAKDYFPSQIKLNMIVKGGSWNPEDRKLRSRRVVKETVKHFFAYVGFKDNNRDNVHGERVLKERWITMVDNKDYKPKYSNYDHREWLQNGGVKKSDITWQMVMRAEIDPREVDLSKGKTIMAKIETQAKEWGAEFSEFVHNYVANPGKGEAEHFLGKMGNEAEKAKEFFADVYKATNNYVYFTKEKAIFWYKEHQYEIKRTLDNHWQLFVTGVKLPFKVIYALDEFLVPWTLAKIDQIEESLDPNKEDPIDHDLVQTDIVEAGAIPNVPNTTTNRHFARYGMYQENFLNAFNASANPKEKYFEDPEDNVAYYITEVTAAEAGAKSTDGPEIVKSKMVTASDKKVHTKFMNKSGWPKAEVEKYTYPIHSLSKTSDPKKMYRFYRMPLPTSAEYHLKSSDHWADYNDPNKYKDRKAFRVDPTQSSLENLRRGLLLDMDPVRGVLNSAAGVASQVPRIIFWNLEMGGNVAKSIGHLFYGAGDTAQKQALDDAINSLSVRPQSQRQYIDELCTSAEKPSRALSEYYKNPENSKLYDFSLQYARSASRNFPLFLGIMKDRPGYEGTRYLELKVPNKTEAQIYADMRLFYEREWKRKPGDEFILTAVNEAEAKAIATPTP